MTDRPKSKVMLNGKVIKKIEISKVGADMRDVKKPHHTYTDQRVKAFQTFVKTVTKAEKVNGIVDVIKPDYFIKISYKDQTTSGYFLWLRSDGGSIMDQNDTNTIYTLPLSVVKDLTKYVL
jgi:hypothetical protein